MSGKGETWSVNVWGTGERYLIEMPSGHIQAAPEPTENRATRRAKDKARRRGKPSGPLRL